MVVLPLFGGVAAIVAGAAVARRWRRQRRIGIAIAAVAAELRRRYTDDAPWRERFHAGDDGALRELVAWVSERHGMTREQYERAVAQPKWAERQRLAIKDAMAGLSQAGRPPIPGARPSRRVKTEG